MSSLLSRTLFAAVLCTGTTIHADTIAHLQAVPLAGVPLTLVQHQGRCGVERAGTITPLSIGWPCAIAPDHTGKPRVETFDGSPIVLVQHLMPEPYHTGDCQSEFQALRWRGGHLEASVTMKTAACNIASTDQKVYTGLFGW